MLSTKNHAARYCQSSKTKLFSIKQCQQRQNVNFYLSNLLIRRYISRLSPCIKAQTRLHNLVKNVTHTIDSDTTLSLNRQWQSTNQRAFRHWWQQLVQLQCQLQSLNETNREISHCFNYSTMTNSANNQCAVMENSVGFSQPLYLIFTTTLKWPLQDITPFNSLWTEHQIIEGNKEILQHLITSPPDLMLIDINYQDETSSTLCRQLHKQHFASTILGVLIESQHDKQSTSDHQQHYPFEALDDYCWWPLKNSPWQKWLKPWLPDRMVTLNYVKRIK